MPMLITTFEAYQAAFPEAGNLQAFRYQIAQAHWRQKDWTGTRKWLGEIVKGAGEGDSFYRDLAQRRLQKVEY
jgi:hypothetical protein